MLHMVNFVVIKNYKTLFSYFALNCFPLLLPAFSTAVFRLAYDFSKHYLFLYARAWLSKRSILSAEEGKSFVLKKKLLFQWLLPFVQFTPPKFLN